MHIRWAIRRDMPEIMAIENDSFAEPMSDDEVINLLFRQRNCIGMVTEHEEKIVGFMLYELHKSHLHLISMAVHRDFRRQGVGKRMIGKLLDKLNPQRRATFRTYVADWNTRAHLFFRSCGIPAVRIEESYWCEDDGDTDAYVFEKSLRAESLATNNA